MKNDGSGIGRHGTRQETLKLENLYDMMLKHTILKNGVVTNVLVDFFSMSEPVPKDPEQATVVTVASPPTEENLDDFEIPDDVIFLYPCCCMYSLPLFY